MSRLRTDYSTIRGSVAKVCNWIEAVALTVTCCAFTSGCVPIPVVKWTSLPDAEAKLPADLRGSRDEVLVARQISSESWSAAVVQLPDKGSLRIITVDFMKASDLVSFTKTLNLESTTGLVLALPFSKFGVGGATSERLEKLCVVTRDGRVIALVGNGSRREPVFLDAGRRDAIVAALNGGGTTPFVGVDGPCGVSGTAEWPVELRSRVIDFLARIPAIKPHVAASDVVSNDVLAAALRDSWTTGTQAELGSGAMLLVSGIWRGVPIAERPRFLTAEEFDRFGNSRVTVNADAIITLLPTYASGSYDPSSVTVASFCLISSDGRAISASGPTHLESPNTRPRLPNWRDGAVAHLRSGSGSFDLEFPCIPPDTLGWSAADRAAAIRFLAVIPAPSPSADASLGAVSDAADAGVLVLAVNSARGGTVIVPTFMASDDAKAVVSAIRSHTPSQFTALIAPFEDQSLDYVCVIALDGQVTSFGSSGIQDSWRGSYELFSVSDQSICSLEKSAKWPEEVRTQVSGFLKRIPSGK